MITDWFEAFFGMILGDAILFCLFLFTFTVVVTFAASKIDKVT